MASYFRNIYGPELVMNLSGCDISTFTKKSLETYLLQICRRIKMKRHGKPLIWVDKSKIPHLRGVGALQYIETSSITIHALDLHKAVFINIFSCKNFDTKIAQEYSKEFFKASRAQAQVIKRRF